MSCVIITIAFIIYIICFPIIVMVILTALMIIDFIVLTIYLLYHMFKKLEDKKTNNKRR